MRFLIPGILLVGGLTAFVWAGGPQVLSFPGTTLFSSAESIPTPLGEPLAATPVTVLFGGDLMFDRWIRTVSGKRGGEYILAPVREYLQVADLVVANLEGPITDSPSVSETSALGSRDNYVFTFPTETATLLKRENIGLVNIGNNHILNFKEDGVRQTKEFLEQAGVEYFGSPLTDDVRYHVRDVRGTRIAFVNYNQFVWHGREKAFDDIAAVKEQTDFVVVYTHWGDEYVATPQAVKDIAHAFVDAGADLIIGSHPHVIQEREEYKGKTIYYSLGNMVFDQYFSPETQAGLLVTADFDVTAGTITTKETRIRLHSNGQTSAAPR